MTGFSGLADRPQNDHLDAERFVENHPVANVFELYRAGLLVGEAVELPEPDETDGGGRRPVPPAGKFQTVRITWEPAQAPPMFLCPSCGSRRYKLHGTEGRWWCRKCANLDFWSRHKGRTVPGLSRARWLRRRLGASAELFSRIEPRSRHHRRYWRLVIELRQLEARIAVYLGANINSVLERRYGPDPPRRPRR